MIIGEISIGCTETNNMSYISKKIYNFKLLYPIVKIIIHTSSGYKIKNMMEKGTLDFGLLVEPIEISNYNFIHLSNNEIGGVLASNKFDIFNNSYVNSKNLIEIPLFLPYR